MADGAVSFDDEDSPPPKKEKELTRETELTVKRGKEGRELKEKLIKLYADVEEGFVNQGERSDDQIDYWDAYECDLGGYQAYSGNAQVFVPVFHNAVNARATRFTNQLFPKGGRYVEVVSTDGEEPHAITALLEHYVRRAKLRTEVAFPLCINGDVEGQYNVYVSWSTQARHVVWKETRTPEVMGARLPGEDEQEEIVEDVILEDHPVVEVLPDADVLILPVTSNSVPHALSLGGSATIIRRWTKAQLEEMIERDEVIEEEADALLKEMSKQEKDGHVDTIKHHADAAGVKAKGKVCLGYETWKVFEIDGKQRLCRILFGGDKIILSCRLNPYWSDRCPLISAPVRKKTGVVKGVSPAKYCMKIQYAANDVINQGFDSATYSLLPIVMTDPAKNPQVDTMILDLAAVWKTSPTDTQFAKFPSLWKDAFEIIAACQAQIFQTLSVNTAMIPQGSSKGGKQNQAQVAQEQQVDILTTADAVTVLEESVFTEILERFAELDAQYRNDEITVKAYGYMGMRATLERIPPLQLGRRYNFLWYGVEQARNAAQIQQQIALINVIRGVPPQMLPGRRVNMVPAIEHAVSAAFGPRLAPLVFEDLTKTLSYDPALENKILEENHRWPVSPMDDDAKHIEAHMPVETLAAKQHIAMHRMAQIQKAMAQQAQAGGTPGTPGQPGIAGTRPGAQPQATRPSRGPNGAIGPEQMTRAGAPVPPRRA